MIYPVITLSGKPAHHYSGNMLPGKNPENELVDYLSTHNRVNAHSPPTFLVYAHDGSGLQPENGMLSIRHCGSITFGSLHIYDHGDLWHLKARC